MPQNLLSLRKLWLNLSFALSEPEESEASQIFRPAAVFSCKNISIDRRQGSRHPDVGRPGQDIVFFACFSRDAVRFQERTPNRNDTAVIRRKGKPRVHRSRAKKFKAAIPGFG